MVSLRRRSSAGAQGIPQGQPQARRRTAVDCVGAPPSFGHPHATASFLHPRCLLPAPPIQTAPLRWGSTSAARSPTSSWRPIPSVCGSVLLCGSVLYRAGAHSTVSLGHDPARILPRTERCHPERVRWRLTEVAGRDHWRAKAINCPVFGYRTSFDQPRSEKRFSLQLLIPLTTLE